MATDSVTIHFEGRSLAVRGGTSVAVALWEQGIRVLSHSPKYGRPRGLFCARGHCTSCLMRIDGVPNVRACATPVAAGMRVERQDTGPFYAKPLQKTLEVGEALFPVGFYYKWFTHPAFLSRLFLKGLRPLTGCGRLPAEDAWQETTPPRSEDLGPWDRVVVGGGPTGLAAILAATGRALLVDDHPEPGGQRWPALRSIAADGAVSLERFPVLHAAHHRLQRLTASLAERVDLDRRLGTRVVAGYQPGGLVLRGENGLATLNTGSLHWAAGALDVVGLFPGNDVPGLCGPRALYRLIGRDGMDVAGCEAVVCGGGLDLWLSAALLASRGARVTVVLGEPGWQTEAAASLEAGWPLHTGLELASARWTDRRRPNLVFLPPCERNGHGVEHIELSCDLAVICRRGKPVYDVLYQLGAPLVLQPEYGGYLPAGAERGRSMSPLPGDVELLLAGEAAGRLPGDVVNTGQKAAER